VGVHWAVHGMESTSRDLCCLRVETPGDHRSAWHELDGLVPPRGPISRFIPKSCSRVKQSEYEGNTEAVGVCALFTLPLRAA
jgi:hypothetical protein